MIYFDIIHCKDTKQWLFLFAFLPVYFMAFCINFDPESDDCSDTTSTNISHQTHRRLDVSLSTLEYIRNARPVCITRVDDPYRLDSNHDVSLRSNDSPPSDNSSTPSSDSPPPSFDSLPPSFDSPSPSLGSPPPSFDSCFPNKQSV